MIQDFVDVWDDWRAVVEKKIRDYLQTQFGIVLEILKSNAVLLEKIVTALNEKTFLVKEDFLKLAKEI